MEKIAVILACALLLMAAFMSGEKMQTRGALYLDPAYQIHSRALVIIPVLTGNAYLHGGFYDYYSGRCGTDCLSVRIDPYIALKEESSQSSVHTLSRLGYEFTNDYFLDAFLQVDPGYLSQYERVIVLHSEYVTMRIFNALQSHPMVIYLSPNALYGMVEIRNETMTLIQGHGYKTESGFGWKYDNTHPAEFDKKCLHWKFDRIPNGYQLNCNPEHTIWKNLEMIKALGTLE